MVVYLFNASLTDERSRGTDGDFIKYPGMSSIIVKSMILCSMKAVGETAASCTWRFVISLASCKALELMEVTVVGGICH